MSRKRRKRDISAKRAAKREAGRSMLPEGAVPADLAKQVPNNSYAGPVLFYVDQPFVCVDCGRQEVWTARQQKWYYEVAKGSLYATAVRCKACRRKRADTHNGQGDPNPIKHEGTLIKRVQTAMAPAMAEAGFVLVSKSMRPDNGSVALDYSRDDLALTCRYDCANGTLAAESLDQHANCSVIANVSMNAPRSTSQILDRIQEFTNAVNQYVAGLPARADDAASKKP